MKHCLIAEELALDIAEDIELEGCKLHAETLRNLPEAHPLDLTKLERWKAVAIAQASYFFEGYEPFVRYADLLGAVQPDASVLVEALEKAIEDLEWMSGSEDFSSGGKAEKGWRKVQMHIKSFNEALSAYRGGK